MKTERKTHTHVASLRAIQPFEPPTGVAPCRAPPCIILAFHYIHASCEPQSCRRLDNPLAIMKVVDCFQVFFVCLCQHPVCV